MSSNRRPKISPISQVRSDGGFEEEVEVEWALQSLRGGASRDLDHALVWEEPSPPSAYSQPLEWDDEYVRRRVAIQVQDGRRDPPVEPVAPAPPPDTGFRWIKPEEEEELNTPRVERRLSISDLRGDVEVEWTPEKDDTQLLRQFPKSDELDDSHQFDAHFDTDSSSDSDDDERSMPEKKPSCGKRWAQFVYSTHPPVIRAIKAVSLTAARNPWRTVNLTAFVSVCLVAIGLFTNFRIEADEENLWTPESSLARKHPVWIESEEVYGPDARGEFLIFHANGANMLRLVRCIASQ